MKTSVNVYDFERAFETAGRSNSFSYAGLHALFEYLEQYEEDCGTELELDVIALCCDFTEYSDFAELQSNYPDIESMDDLHDHTTVIMIDDEGFIIGVF